MSSPSSSSSSSKSGNGSGGHQACAACKYQRRKCTPDCELAPYFPPSNRHQFLNAHKLFGVRNIVKIVRSVSPSLRDDAMRSVIFESDARARDPVGGCSSIIQELQEQIQRNTAELILVQHYLSLCRGCLSPIGDPSQLNSLAKPPFDPNMQLSQALPSSLPEEILAICESLPPPQLPFDSPAIQRPCPDFWEFLQNGSAYANINDKDVISRVDGGSSSNEGKNLHLDSAYKESIAPSLDGKQQFSLLV